MDDVHENALPKDASIIRLLHELQTKEAFALGFGELGHG